MTSFSSAPVWNLLGSHNAELKLLSDVTTHPLCNRTSVKSWSISTAVLISTIKRRFVRPTRGLYGHTVWRYTTVLTELIYVHKTFKAGNIKLLNNENELPVFDPVATRPSTHNSLYLAWVVWTFSGHISFWVAVADSQQRSRSWSKNSNHNPAP